MFLNAKDPVLGVPQSYIGTFGVYGIWGMFRASGGSQTQENQILIRAVRTFAASGTEWGHILELSV